MGLKQDFLDAKLEGLRLGGASLEAIEKAGAEDSPLAIQCEMEKEAIVNFLTKANLRVTQLNAPVVLEDIQTSDLDVNVKMETLLGEYGPILSTLKTIAAPAGAGELVDELQGQIEKAVKPVLKGGSTLPGLNLNKSSGGLTSTGYVHIGSDPDSQESFDVADEDGQRQFTTVKLIREDIEDLL